MCLICRASDHETIEHLDVVRLKSRKQMPLRTVPCPICETKGQRRNPQTGYTEGCGYCGGDGYVTPERGSVQ